MSSESTGLSAATSRTVMRVLLGGAALLVLGGFLFSLGEILNPLVLFLVLVALLVPFRGAPGHTLVVSLAGALTFYWLLTTTGFLIAPFVLGLVLAYVLDPLVDKLEARGVSRTLAIVLLALPVAAGLVVAIVVGVPAVAGQVNEVIQGAPALRDRVLAWLEGARSGALGFDLPGLDEEALLERLRGVDGAAIIALLQARWRAIGAAVLKGVLGLGSGLGTALTILGYVVLTPVLTFYLLRDYDLIIAKARDFIPRSREKAVVDFAREYDGLLSSYLRGQLTVALILGALMALGLLIARFDNWLLLGSLVGVLSLIPYLGLALSLIPAVIIALTSGAVKWSLLKLAVVYVVTQTMEGTLISPRILGESVGLHPVWVVLALSVSGFFFGFVGLLVAIPLAVGVKLLVVRGVDRYRSSDLYRGVVAAD